MPIVRVQMFEGRTKEQKKEIVEVFSKELARITGCGVNSVYVVLDEVNKENWGAGGELCSDKFPD